MKFPQPLVREWLPCLALYGIVLAANGYIFGSNDHAELLPYARYLADPSRYPHDFFIQNMAAHTPNERWITAKLLSWFSEHLETATALLHALFGVLFIAGMRRLSLRFVDHESWSWIVLLLYFVPFYRLNLGGNDLYYNTLIASNIAKTAGIWAIVFLLQSRTTLAYGLLSLATLVHPLAGGQLFLLCTGAGLLHAVLSGTGLRQWIRSNALQLSGYTLTAGLWLVAMYRHYQGESFQDSAYLEIIEFRAPHHYLPQYFGAKNYALLLPLFAWSAGWYRRRDPRIAWIFAIALTGCAVYCLVLYGFQSALLVPSQWFKSTIWLKLFSVIALTAALEGFFNRLAGRTTWYRTALSAVRWVVVGAALVLAVRGFRLSPRAPYDFCWNHSRSDEQDIALLSKALTPPDAVFVQPAAFTAFKYYSERSSYVDFKTIAHQKNALAEWYRRIQTVYRVDNRIRSQTPDVRGAADARFFELQADDFIALRRLGVTHIVTSADRHLPFLLLASNHSYALYAL